jgi:hypothetical protein
VAGRTVGARSDPGELRAGFADPGDAQPAAHALVREQSSHVLRVQKTLEDANIKLDSVLADLMGKSGRAMIEALIAPPGRGIHRSPGAVVDAIVSRRAKRRKRPRNGRTAKPPDVATRKSAATMGTSRGGW